MIDQKKQYPPWNGYKLEPGTDTSTLKNIKQKLDALLDDVLSQLDPYKRVLQAVSFDGNIVRCGGCEVPFKENTRVITVGAGKASHQMAEAIYEIFAERAYGLVNTHKDLGDLPPSGNIKFQPAGHPNPDDGSLKGAQEIIKLLESAGPNDIVFSLISGGGSAMMELPAPGVTLNDYIRVNDLLNRTGVDIEKWNTLRKHLSEIKGGKLARKAEGAAKVFNLMVSDVKDDRPDVIASGPFAADPSTFADAYEVLKELKSRARKLGIDIPPAVINHLKSNRGMKENETLKTDPHNVVHVMIATNNTAIDLAAARLETMGIPAPRIHCLRNICGDVAAETVRIYSSLVEMVNKNLGAPAAVIAGGEATVDVTGFPGYRDGKSFGGRMQMMAALMLHLIEDLPVTGLFAATDCRDGKAPPGKPQSAGALIDGNTLKQSQTLSIDTEPYINACNTYELHQKLSSQLLKKSFITNVMDLVVLLYWPPAARGSFLPR